MNILKPILFGILGLIIGYKIPSMSNEVIKYKKSKTNLEIDLISQIHNKFRLSLCFFHGVFWFIAGLNVGNIIVALLISVQITLGIIIAYIDIKIRIIPNELVLAMFIVGIIFQTINYGLQGIAGSIVCMIFIMVVFTVIAGVMGFGKVGAGDIKLAGSIGFALGYPLVVVAMLTMAIVLLAYILIGLALRKVKLTTLLPLAPFLSVGYIFSLLALIIGVNIY